jgi:hypothetical protein
MLSKIVQESVEKTVLDLSYGGRGNFLDDTMSMTSTKNVLISSQISLLEAELERKKGMIRCDEECYRPHNHQLERIRDEVTQEDITYITEQIEEIKKLITK